VQNRQENRDRVKIEEMTIVRQISAFKASVIKRLDELEKSALLEMQTASQNYISQMEREESELEKSVSLIEKHLQQLIGGEEETRACWSHSLSKSQVVVNVSRSMKLTFLTRILLFPFD
jgi:uncharacterized membrane protein